MIPARIVFVDALPLTASGKVDRRSLPDPGDAAAASEEPYVAPATAVEELLASAWTRLLGVEQVGRHDNFFALGGHSLLATRFVSQVRQLFGRDLPLRVVFAAPTIVGIARHLVETEPSPGSMEKIARARQKVAAMSPDEVLRALRKRRPAGVNG
jgi:hypothetical protein